MFISCGRWWLKFLSPNDPLCIHSFMVVWITYTTTTFLYIVTWPRWIHGVQAAYRGRKCLHPLHRFGKDAINISTIFHYHFVALVHIYIAFWSLRCIHASRYNLMCLSDIHITPHIWYQNSRGSLVISAGEIAIFLWDLHVQKIYVELC